jgi:geranylgeranyl pyrophosphate synthase
MNAKKLELILEKYAKIIEPVVIQFLDSGIDIKTKPLVNYQISTGGKRLRPVIAIICCQLFGGKIKDVIMAAAGLEILHNYSLISDDMIDQSRLRRGQPTVWTKFGTSIAECVAVDYGVTVFQGANRSKEPQKISEILAKTIKKIVDGQILDILFEQNGRTGEHYVVKNRYKKITEREYFKMVSEKTSAPFEAACEIGGICTGVTKKKLNFLRKFGFNLGIAFQIKDDYLDIFGGSDQEPGKDIKERKLGNLVILLALRELSIKDKNKLISIMKKKNITQNDINVGVKIISQTNAGNKALAIGERYIRKAKESLLALPENKWNNLLAEIADFVINREK